MDRYWAVTNVDYIYRRTRRRVAVMIVCAWTVGAVVSLAPIFGWKDPDFAYRVLVEHKCMVSQDVGYQIFATISTFYAPLVLLLALYWRIFQVSTRPELGSARVGPALSGGGSLFTCPAESAAPRLCFRVQLCEIRFHYCCCYTWASSAAAAAAAAYWISGRRQLIIMESLWRAIVAGRLIVSCNSKNVSLAWQRRQQCNKSRSVSARYGLRCMPPGEGP